MEQLAQYSEGFRKGSPITCGTSIMKKISSRSYILGPNGKLTGFELDRDRGQFDRKGYLDGYSEATGLTVDTIRFLSAYRAGTSSGAHKWRFQT